MSSTLESMTASVRRLSCVVVPLYIVVDGPAQLLYAIPGTRQPWLPIVFAVAWLLTAASALSKYRRGSYVTWSSYTARPFQAVCLLALNVAVWPAMGLLNPASTSSLMQSATIPAWICGLGAAMATVVTALFLRFPQANPATMTGEFNPSLDVRAFRCGIAPPPKAAISAD